MKTRIVYNFLLAILALITVSSCNKSPKAKEEALMKLFGIGNK